MYKLRTDVLWVVLAAFAFAFATPSWAQSEGDKKKAPADAAKPADDKAKPDAAVKPADDKAKPGDAAKPNDGEPGGDKAKPDKVKPAPGPRTPTPEDIEKAKSHYIKGAELVEEKQLEEAVKEFKMSYRLSRNALLLYNIGFVYDELKDKNMALFYYKKFLKDAPGKSDNHTFASKRARKLARELDADAMFSGGGGGSSSSSSSGGGGGGDTGGDGGGDGGGPADVKEFMHQVVEDAPPAIPLDLTAFIPDNARWQLSLSFRSQGDSKFTTTVMKPRYNEMVGRIPAEKMAGSTVQYYIEVKDKSGKIVARSGRANSPNILFIDENARAQYYPDFGDDEREYVGGGGGGGGGVFTPTGDGYLDVGSDKFRYTKWGTTATAATLLTTGLVYYFLAANAASDLEGEAAVSTATNTCNDGRSKPCTQYGEYQQDLEAYGERTQTIYKVSMGLGLVTAGVAGYLWWKEIKAHKDAKRGNSVTVVPMVGEDVVGGAAVIEF